MLAVFLRSLRYPVAKRAADAKRLLVDTVGDMLRGSTFI
jgi:hypothetical protein